MHTHTDLSPATAQPPAAPGTGAGAQASTRHPANSQAFAAANIAWLDAKASCYRATEAMYRAQANAHMADPHTPPADRLGYFTAASNRAEDYALLARDAQQRADNERMENPAAALAAIGEGAPAPMAVVVLTIQRDRIQQTARLLLGAPRTASRTWNRLEGRGSWQSRDPDWSVYEERIGVELAEYMDAIDLPGRVADMLPRPPAPASDAAARAAEEVRRG